MPERPHEPLVEPSREPYFEPGRSHPDSVEPSGVAPDDWQGQNDLLLGGAAMMLLEDGHEKAAALLHDVRRLTFDSSNGWFDGPSSNVIADLLVDPWVVRRFDDVTKEQVKEALHMVVAPQQLCVYMVRVAPAPASPGWREHLQSALASPGARNQASIVPPSKPQPREDGLAFRDPTERTVYRAFKARQEAMPKTDTFTILPNPGARVAHRTVEPDFVITYRGRCAGVEVDGASHSRKWASDRSREYSLEDSGFAFVRRIDAADTENPQELRTFVDSVLRKLGSN